MKKLTKKEKILLGTTLLSATVAGYFGFKCYDFKKKNDEIDFIKFLVIESDCVPKALQNAENKLVRRETKIKELSELLLSRPNSTEIKVALEKYEKEASVLRYQLSKTYKLNDILANDGNVYAK